MTTTVAEVPSTKQGVEPMHEAEKSIMLTGKYAAAATDRVDNPATVALLKFLDFSRLAYFLRSPRKFIAGILLIVVKPILILSAVLLWPFGCCYVWFHDLIDVCSKLRQDLELEDGIGERISLFLNLVLIAPILLASLVLSLPIILVLAGSLAMEFVRKNPETILTGVTFIVGAVLALAAVIAIIYLIVQILAMIAIALMIGLLFAVASSK
jgi:hypothetical protein